VETDYALRHESEQEMERLREELTKRGISGVRVTSSDITHFRVEGVLPTQDADFRQTAPEVQVNFDRSPGANGTYIFAMKAQVQSLLRQDAVIQTRETIERRVNELGVTEPSMALQGRHGDEMLVQLPGVTNVDHAKEIIQAGGLLEWKLVEHGPAATRDRLMTNGQLPPATEILPGAPGVPGDPSGTPFYLVKQNAAVTGRDLRNARPSLDENNQPIVTFTLNTEGGRKFGNVTAENIGRQLAIVVDGRVRSAPRIDARITTDGSIHGNFTPQEAQDLALLLCAG
jgi:preprotein translocase subunit SecD